MAKAVVERNMIEAGDKIMVAVSGGKDSYVMLRLLERSRRIAPIEFSLLAVHLDQGQPGFQVQRVRQQLESTEVPWEIIERDTYSIVKEKLEPGQTTCSLCSRLRRGILYNAAVERGCTKIALGHHRDDLIHTLLLNLFFTGQIKTMAPRLTSDDGRNIVIRPLMHCAEDDIAAYAEELGFRAAPCTLCTEQDGLQRRMVRELVDDLETRIPGVKESIFASLHNVRRTHLLDTTL